MKPKTQEHAASGEAGQTSLVSGANLRALISAACVLALGVIWCTVVLHSPVQSVGSPLADFAVPYVYQHVVIAHLLGVIPLMFWLSSFVTRKLRGRALLVEDNPVNARVALRLLSLLGIEADMVGDGRAALEKIARTTYDLILMDCQMPVMDGYTATRTRREDERQKGLPRLPIIAMTANAMAGDREKCLDAGMDDYLTKPLDRGLLEATIARWLPDAVGEKSKAAATPASSLGTGQPPQAPPMAPPRPAAGAPAPPTAAATPPAPVPASAATQAPAIDQAVVQELLEVMGDGFAGLVRVYFEDTPKLLERLREAVDMTDHDTIAEITHSLKSSSANLGALPLAELAKRAEIDARAKRSDELGSLPTRANNEYQRVVQAYASLGLT